MAVAEHAVLDQDVRLGDTTPRWVINCATEKQSGEVYRVILDGDVVVLSITIKVPD